MGLKKINFDGAKPGDWGHGWPAVRGDFSEVTHDMGFGGPETEEVKTCYCTIQHAWAVGNKKVIVEGDCSSIISKIKQYVIPSTST